MIDASRIFDSGINMRLNHFSFAPRVAGRIHGTDLSLPSRASSQRNTLSFIKVSSDIYPSLRRIPTAIPRSKLGPTFLIFAGAKFTVMRVVGSFAQLDFRELLSRSLLSCTP
jgi:hypothetical protein